MVSPRWRKVLRDLTQNKGRTALVTAAIAVGVIAAGSILTGYSVITREMDRNYADTNPPSAVLYMDDVDDDLVAAVRARPEIADAEARREIPARLEQGPDEWLTLQLVVVDDFDDVTVGRFYPEEGAWIPDSDEILIERSSLTEVDMSIGDDIIVTAPGGSPQSLSVAGLVHDPGRTPAWMIGVVVGYVTPDGLAELGLDPVLDTLQIVTVDNDDREDNLRIAEAVVADLAADGIDVHRLDVPPPGDHPASSVLTTMLFLLQAFGVTALVTSGALVATLITAQLKQQSREIAIMKAIGAQTGQIAGLYVGTVAILTVVALAIGIPLGILGGRAFVDFTFGLLNFEVGSYKLDAWVIPLQIVSAISIPILAVIIPVIRSSRMPVRSLLSDEGATSPSTGRTAASPRLDSSRIGRITSLGIRNSFRNRSRTVLTVLSIALGGAAFMVALNTGAAWNNAVDAEFEARTYALRVDLDQPYQSQQLEQILSDIPKIDAVETWNQYPAAIQLDQGGVGDNFGLVFAPPDTDMIDYPVTEGRWFEPGETGAVVITQTLDDPAPAVGDTISIEVEGSDSSWTVVGKVRQLSGGQTALAYASNLPPGVGREGTANQIRISGDDAETAMNTVELRLAENGIDVVTIATAADGREALDDHFLIIVGLLMTMAILISVVGGLGLIEAMSISVLERRRELGVMRAVGASTAKVLQVVIVEGVLIAAMSWMAALAISVPASIAVGNITGNLFLEAPLPISFSAAAPSIWLAIVIVLAAVASAIPALEITETPVNQALAYQ